MVCSMPVPCPSLSPGICSNSCPLSQWCHPTISSSIAPFSSCPQSFPASGSFPMSPLFASGGQRIRASTSASVLPVNIQGWFLLGLTGLIFWSPRNSQESSPAPQFKSINSSAFSFLLVWLSHVGQHLVCYLYPIILLLKIRDITLPKKVHLVNYGFSVVLYRCGR